MLTFPVIPAKAGIQVPLEADIVLVRDSGLRRNDEIGLLNCRIIKCQHYLVTGEKCKTSNSYRHSRESGNPQASNHRHHTGLPRKREWRDYFRRSFALLSSQ